MVVKKNLYGFKDKTGKVVIKPRFNHAEDFQDGIALVKKDDKWGFIDKTGAWVVEPKFKDISNISGKELPLEVRADGKWGLLDGTGWIAEPKFDWVESFYEGFEKVQLDGKWGVINRQGGWFVEPKCDDVQKYRYGAKVKLDGKWGIIDTTGAWLLEPKYEDIRILKGGELFYVILEQADSADEAYGIVDKAGKWAVTFTDVPERKELESWEDDVFKNNDVPAIVVTVNNRKGAIDPKTGKWIIEPKYESLYIQHSSYLKSDVAEVKIKGKWGIIDLAGKVIVKPQYDDISVYGNSPVQVEKDGLTGLVDKTGKEILKPQYHAIGEFKNGVAPVKKDRRWGLIDTTGKEIVKLQYTKIYGIVYKLEDYFKDKLIDSWWVKTVDHKWIRIDSKGNELSRLDIDYYAVKPFGEGSALVQEKENGPWGIVDINTGALLVEPSFEEKIEYIKEGMVKVTDDSYPHDFGAVSLLTGKLVLPMKFGFINDFNDGIVNVMLKKRDAIIGINGKYILTAPTYTKTVRALGYNSLNFSDGLIQFYDLVTVDE